MENINRNSDRAYVTGADINNEHSYPLFFKQIKFERFRHIKDLTVSFDNPISVITGSNRAGKTTILLSIACSHYNFKRRNVTSGTLERSRWGNIMKFTRFDKQTSDWTYYVNYKEGLRKIENKRGQRKSDTCKWNGVAKKESQIGVPTDRKPEGGRSVILIDLDRIVPGRGLPSSIFGKIKNQNSTALLAIKAEYISYILELPFEIGSIKAADKEIFNYKNNNFEYTSYNTASGEDVLSRIISDIVDAEKNSLILIEEIEIGLHPKIQRRLIDIIYHESKKNKKQFIITTHSSTVLSSVDDSSRIFIENNNDEFKSIYNISINAALSKMDSFSYPLINIFLEDDIAEKIVKKAIQKIIDNRTIYGFNDLINIIKSGPANITYLNFQVHKSTYEFKKINCGYACILDGDMQNKKDSRSNFLYPNEDGLFFVFSNDAPELFLMKKYLEFNRNDTLSYHLNSDPHCLFGKMVENWVCGDVDSAFEICWDCFLKTEEGMNYLNLLCDFLLNQCMKFSPNL